MKQLIVEPILGLGNRLLTLMSAQRIAAVTGRDLRLIWGNNYEGQAQQSGCRFSELFANAVPQLASFDDVADDSLVRFVRRPQFTPVEVEVPGAIDLPEHAALDLGACQHADVVGITAFNPVRLAGEAKGIGSPELAPYFAALRPVRLVDDEVRRFRTAELRGPTLGIHIRRGDHGGMLDQMGAGQTSDADFWTFVDGCLTAVPGLRVFLATDDRDVRARFMHRFGDRACTYAPRSLDRATPVGMQGALIDMLLLSHCDYVCGTAYSTFTTVAMLRHRARRRRADQCGFKLRAGMRRIPRVMQECIAHTRAAIERWSSEPAELTELTAVDDQRPGPHDTDPPVPRRALESPVACANTTGARR